MQGSEERPFARVGAARVFALGTRLAGRAQPPIMVDCAIIQQSNESIRSLKGKKPKLQWFRLHFDLAICLHCCVSRNSVSSLPPERFDPWLFLTPLGIIVVSGRAGAVHRKLIQVGDMSLSSRDTCEHTRIGNHIDSGVFLSLRSFLLAAAGGDQHSRVVVPPVAVQRSTASNLKHAFESTQPQLGFQSMKRPWLRSSLDILVTLVLEMSCCTILQGHAML